MRKVVADLDNDWVLHSSDIDTAIRASKRNSALPPLFTCRAAATLAADIFLIYQKVAEGL